MENKTVITISREYRSGGRQIGRRLAEYLDIGYYDKKILESVAAELGLSPEFFSDSNLNADGLFSIGVPGLGLSHLTDLSVNVQMIEKARSLMTRIARTESAVFVGRAADAVLGPGIRKITVFIRQDFDQRVEACMQEEGLNRRKARARVREMDDKRRSLVGFAGKQGWGRPENYDVVLDMSRMTEEEALQKLARLYDEKQGYETLKGGYLDQYTHYA